MGQRGPKPDYDVGEFVLAVEMGMTHADLAERYGISRKAVERRIHRLRVLGSLRPAPGRPRPEMDVVLQRQRRAEERRQKTVARRARKEAYAALEIKRQEDARRAEEEQVRIQEAAEHAAFIAKRDRDAARWHEERKARNEAVDGPVLDLFLG